MRLAYILFLVLLLATSFASAELDVITYSTNTGFTAFSPAADISMCQCETRTDVISITNTGVYASRFSIVSSEPDLVRIAESVVEILPGQSRDVYAYIEASCDDEFSVDYYYEITDVFHNQQFIQKSLDVGTCQNLEATLTADQTSPVLPCTPITYTMDIMNTGVFTETYDVDFGGERFEDAFSNSFQSIVIPAGQTGRLSSTLQFTCDVYGNFTVPSSVEARQNGLVADFEHDVVVESDYDFDVELESEDICALDESSFELIISNEGGFDNNFTISMTNHPFASFNTTTVSVDAGDEESVFVTLNPQKSNLGSSGVSFVVTDAIAGVSKEVKANFSVENCHVIAVDIPLDENIRDCSGDHEIPVVLQNLGSVRETISLSTIGPYAWPEDSVIILDANESQEFNIIMDIPTSDSFAGQIWIVAQTDQLLSNDSIMVDYYDEFRCSQIVAHTDKAWFKLGKTDTKGSVFLRNDGLLAGWYDIIYAGDEWMSLANYSERLYFEPGEVKEIIFYGYQDNRTVMLSSVFDGSLSVYDEYGHEYLLPIQGRMYRDNIVIRAYDYFKVRPCLFVSIVLLTLIVAALIVSFLLPRPKKRLPWLIIALLAVWVVIVVVVYATAGLPSSIHQPLPNATQEWEFVIAEDTSLVMNASAFFVDPDGDNLTFNVSEIDDVDVSVDGGLITFTPKPDWFGERRFRIYAFDGEEETRSPRMYLTVIDQPELSLWDYYEQYCRSVNLVLLFVAFVLLYVVVIQLRTKWSKKKPAKRAVTKKTAKKTAKKSSKKKK